MNRKDYLRNKRAKERRRTELLALGEVLTGCIIACSGVENDAVAMIVVGLLIMAFSGLTLLIKG